MSWMYWHILCGQNISNRTRPFTNHVYKKSLRRIWEIGVHQSTHPTQMTSRCESNAHVRDDVRHAEGAAHSDDQAVEAAEGPIDRLKRFGHQLSVQYGLAKLASKRLRS